MELACERFEFCPEVTAKACRMGLRIPRCRSGISGSRREGKKIRFRDAVEAVRTLRWRKWQPKCPRWRPSQANVSATDENASVRPPAVTIGVGWAFWTWAEMAGDGHACLPSVACCQADLRVGT